MSVITKQKMGTALTQRLLSNVRDVMGNVEKDVEAMGRPRKVAFFL